jgi:hypothetical protein
MTNSDNNSNVISFRPREPSNALDRIDASGDDDGLATWFEDAARELTDPGLKAHLERTAARLKGKMASQPVCFSLLF